MNVSEYKYYFYCEPIYNNHGKLKALEILTRFTDVHGNLLSYSVIEPQLESLDRWKIFIEQLKSILLWKEYILQNNFHVSLNIDNAIVEHLLDDHVTLQVLREASFVKLEVSEKFESYYSDYQMSALSYLSQYIELWLDDIGSGNINNYDLLEKKLFKVAKIDKYFFWKSIETNGLIDGIITILERCSDFVIIEGVEKKEQLLCLLKFNNCWFQGYIFDGGVLESLNIIPLQVDLFSYLK